MRFFLRRFMLAALFFMPLPLQAGHGLSIDGSLKYPKNFERFAYTSPKARPGGLLNLEVEIGRASCRERV